MSNLHPNEEIDRRTTIVDRRQQPSRLFKKENLIILGIIAIIGIFLFFSPIKPPALTPTTSTPAANTRQTMTIINSVDSDYVLVKVANQKELIIKIDSLIEELKAFKTSLILTTPEATSPPRGKGNE